jgi:hypothetical protein
MLIALLIVAIGMIMVVIVIDGNLRHIMILNKHIMKRNKKLYACGIGIIAVWVAFLWLPHLIKAPFPNGYPEGKVCYSDLNVAYVAAGALFTGFAFYIAIAALKQQRGDVLSKTTLDVFLNVLEKIKNDPSFIESRKYISSVDFITDSAKLNEDIKDKNIEIQDFKTLERKFEPEGKTILTPDLCIQYFCDKMNYVGLILKREYIDTAILDYFRETIIESYRVLEPFLTASRQRKGNTYFIHYTYLYNAALNREKDFEIECDDMIKQFDKDKLKRKEDKLKRDMKELKKQIKLINK